MYLSKQYAHLLHNALDRIDEGLSSELSIRTDRSDLGARYRWIILFHKTLLYVEKEETKKNRTRNWL
jgi:hypothetical protein